MSAATLHWLDYGIIATMLLVTTGIGLFFGFYADDRKKTTNEFLLGSRQMLVVPVALSMISNILPALQVMIEFPAETYAMGTKNLVIFVPVVIVSMTFSGYAILPVFYENNITNCFTYLEIRFSKSVRLLLTLSFISCVLVDTPLTTFFPALEYARYTGHNVHAINALVCAVCIAYTWLGGLRGMVWTGVLQTALMTLSMLCVTAVAVQRAGGLAETWSAVVEGGRLTVPPHTISLTARHTVFSLSAYMFGLWMSVGLVQSFVQRLVALPTLASAKRSLMYFTIGNVLFTAGQCALGLAMYAFYASCDPTRAGRIAAGSYLVPQLVRDLGVAGLGGLFTSAVLCASLGSLSSYAITFAGVIYQDCIESIGGRRFSERTGTLIMQLIVLTLCIYAALMGLYIEQSDWFLRIKLAKMNISAGAVFGVFTLGMFYPRAHSRAVLVATLVSVGTFTWLMIGSKWYGAVAAGDATTAALPVSVSGCEGRNTTNDGLLESTPMAPEADADSFSPYRLSYDWYPMFVALLVWSIAVPLSHVLERREGEPAVDMRMLSPLARRFVGRLQQPVERGEGKYGETDSDKKGIFVMYQTPKSLQRRFTIL